MLTSPRAIRSEADSSDEPPRSSFVSFTNVPLRLPRSRTSHRSPLHEMRACSPETRASSIRSAHAEERPSRQRAGRVSARFVRASTRMPINQRYPEDRAEDNGQGPRPVRFL